MPEYAASGNLFWLFFSGAWFLYVTVVGLVDLQKSSADPYRWSLIVWVKAASLLVFVLSWGLASAILSIAVWSDSFPIWLWTTPVGFYTLVATHPTVAIASMKSAVVANGVVIYAFHKALLDRPIEAVRAKLKHISKNRELPHRVGAEGTGQAAEIPDTSQDNAV